MAVTDPEATPHQRATMLLVPTDAPGFNMVRPLSNMGHVDGPGHWEISYEDCRVPVDIGTLGEVGSGFKVAQDRLGPGRIHHCMRLIGVAERALELMCARAESRVTFGKPVSKRSNIQDWIAESRIEIEMARLLVLKTAWLMDTVGNQHARIEISGIKFAVPEICLRVVDRAIQVHGGGGVSDDFPLAMMWAGLRSLRLADGPDEVHKMSLARRELARQREARG
jgi:acyl-CoA dehydrogenase